ncbi:MAG: hypothetical protein ACXABY_06940, partial [Candidatus Thorarchaeota archaeon]
MKRFAALIIVLFSLAVLAGPPIIWKGNDAQLLGSGTVLDSSGSPIIAFSVNGLTDVDTVTITPSLNDVLTWTGSIWEPVAVAAGGPSTPGSTTDNAVVRWNGTTGMAIQDSNEVIIDDDGTVNISNTGGAGTPKTFVKFNNNLDQVPAFDCSDTTSDICMMVSEAGVEKWRIQTNGNARATGFQTVTGVVMSSDNIERSVNQGKIEFMNMSPTIPAIKIKSDTAGTAIRSMLEVETNNVASRGVIVKGIAAQTADLVDLRDSADSTVFKVTPNGRTEFIDSA